MSELTPAPTGYPIKLVRDQTATLINASGQPGDLFYADCPDDIADLWLRKKLAEETAEYLLEPGEGELLDVLAVVQALAARHGHTLGDLLYRLSRSPRGGFMNPQMMYGRHPEFDGDNAAHVTARSPSNPESSPTSTQDGRE